MTGIVEVQRQAPRRIAVAARRVMSIQQQLAWQQIISFGLFEVVLPQPDRLSTPATSWDCVRSIVLRNSSMLKPADQLCRDHLTEPVNGGSMLNVNEVGASRRATWGHQHGGAPAGRPRVSVDSFRDDPMYPKVERTVAAILARGKVVAPVDVIVRLGWLSPADLENWRFGRVAYLERVIRCNLTRLSRFLRILGFHCHDLNLTASQTAYVKWGKGRRTPLRFTKTGDAALERVYARHFIWPGKGPFHPPRQRADHER